MRKTNLEGLKLSTLEVTMEDFYNRTVCNSETGETRMPHHQYTDDELDNQGVTRTGMMSGFSSVGNENWAICIEAGGIQAAGLYFVLLSHVNKKKAKSRDFLDSCYPSIARLMEETGMSKPTIVKYINILTEIGMIAYVQGSNKDNSSNKYIFPRDPWLYRKQDYVELFPAIMAMKHEAKKKNVKKKDAEVPSEVSSKPVELLKDVEVSIEPVEKESVSTVNTERLSEEIQSNIIDVSSIIENKKIEPKVIDISTLGSVDDNKDEIVITNTEDDKEEPMLDISTVGVETTTNEVVNYSKEVNIETIISGMETLKEVTDKNKNNYGSYDVKDFNGKIVNMSYGDDTLERRVMYSYTKEIPDNIMTKINKSKENTNDKMYKICSNCILSFDCLEHWITTLKSIA